MLSCTAQLCAQESQYYTPPTVTACNAEYSIANDWQSITPQSKIVLPHGWVFTGITTPLSNGTFTAYANFTEYRYVDDIIPSDAELPKLHLENIPITVKSIENCPAPVCNIPMDIILALPESGNLSSAEWIKQIDIAKNFVRTFPISSEDCRIGIVFYSSTARTILPLSNNKNDILQALNTDSKGGQTCLGCAMSQAQLLLQQSTTSSLPRTKFVIVFTESSNNVGDFNDFKTIAASLRHEGIHTIAFNTENDNSITQSDLLFIAGDNANVFNATNSSTNFNGLINRIHQLAPIVCDIAEPSWLNIFNQIPYAVTRHPERYTASSLANLDKAMERIIWNYLVSQDSINVWRDNLVSAIENLQLKPLIVECPSITYGEPLNPIVVHNPTKSPVSYCYRDKYYNPTWHNSELAPFGDYSHGCLLYEPTDAGDYTLIATADTLQTVIPFSILPRPITISAVDEQITFGERPQFDFKITEGELFGNDYPAVLSTIAEYKVGPQEIIQSLRYISESGWICANKLTDNYDVRFIPGTLTILPPPISANGTPAQATSDTDLQIPLPCESTQAIIEIPITDYMGLTIDNQFLPLYNYPYNQSNTYSIYVDLDQNNHKTTIIPLILHMRSYLEYYYDIPSSIQTFSLTITKSCNDITISAKEEHIAFGEEPKLHYEITKGTLAEGDGLSGALEIAEYNIGTQEILQGSLSANHNYRITFEPNTLTIAPPTITVNGSVPEQLSNTEFFMTAPCGKTQVPVDIPASAHHTISINGEPQSPFTMNLWQYGYNTIPITLTAKAMNVSQTLSLTVRRPMNCKEEETKKEPEKEIETAVQAVQKQFMTYPNPVHNELYLNSEYAIQHIKLYSATGALVLSQNTFNGKIDLSSLSQGLYSLIVYTSKGIVSTKIVKE
jgi:hypothetical protein